MGLQESFSEYYGSVEPNHRTNNETISGSGNYYIHHAIFSFHYQKAAIYLSSPSKVLLETCTFYNNSSTQNGGSFYFYQSECVIVRTYLFHSSTSYYGGAYAIETDIFLKQKNYAFECSVSECSGSQDSIFHYSGDIQVSNMNTSYHNITFYAAYKLDHPNGRGVMNLTTVSNTSSKSEAGIYNCDGFFNITNCNYISNEYTGKNWGIVRCDGTISCLNCSFIGNKGNYLFDCKPTINNCYFNENAVTKTVNKDYSGTFGSIEPFDSLINHYSTFFCPAKNLKDNQKVSSKNYHEGELALGDINIIVSIVYKISFVVALNIPTLK
ncbi:hypothetical protein TVAG_130110 [Trichomonas vaginalis G3]|uniref:Right handed beta helix domain-containing protein n=1 Tax=Trichomonas vaginalis (strain ATCC PRA-98 / G3) TaxID=412133 RepID=A2DIA7_TRIV3|nr:pectin lyase-like family [Trichomonas vaginalis G3]EAY19903.1 hypothetical protein TVAG_130110 [Trichomonas vaginalis G3]KAI5509963.1 pectin lyase-like family [Trichomonas vaginalis G3]|eukprot:XP_001580889.1 hypothetical protein [Trichomonas vaginalis G3]